MRIDIRTIPHRLQRYPSVGDWYERFLESDDEPRCSVRVSELSDWGYEFLVAIHELVEMALCIKRGISEASVTEFDIAFEKARRKCRHKSNPHCGCQPLDDAEPGDDPKAPYRREHRFAENIERQVAHELGVDWAEYEKAVGAL